MNHRRPILVDLRFELDASLGPTRRIALGNRIGDALERTVSESETLSLDNESDRAVLISRLKHALGLSS